MAVKFYILPEKSLCIVQYHGHVTISETMEEAQRCASHPDFSPSFRHLFDFSKVESHQEEMVEFFTMQAAMVDMYLPTNGELLAVFLVGSPSSHEMVNMVRKTWEGLDAIIIRIQESEAEALALLGLRDTTINDLIAMART